MFLAIFLCSPLLAEISVNPMVDEIFLTCREDSVVEVLYNVQVMDKLASLVAGGWNNLLLDTPVKVSMNK